jgi:hypothetical protein
MLLSTHASASNKMSELAMAWTPAQPFHLMLEEPFRLMATHVALGPNDEFRNDDTEVTLEGRLSGDSPLLTVYSSGEEIYLNGLLDRALCSSSALAKNLLIQRIDFLEQDLQGVLRSSILGGELQLLEHSEIVALRQGEFVALEGVDSLDLMSLGCQPTTGHLRLRLTGIADQLSTALGKHQRDLRIRLWQQFFQYWDAGPVRALLLACLLLFVTLAWWLWGKTQTGRRDAFL